LKNRVPKNGKNMLPPHHLNWAYSIPDLFAPKVATTIRIGYRGIQISLLFFVRPPGGHLWTSVGPKIAKIAKNGLRDTFSSPFFGPFMKEFDKTK